MATARKTTKKAAKKAATKTATKTPTKTARRGKSVDLSAPVTADAPFVRPTIMTSALDLFSDEEDPTHDLAASMREGLDGITQRAKTKQVSFLSPEQMTKLIIPLDELTLQNAIGAVGLRSATMFELIAPEHVGKTTLVANWLGKFGLQGCQSLYIECEGKQMDPNRFLRCVHPNRRVAERLFRLISFTSARTLPQAEHNMNVWVAEARKRSDADPRFAGKPLIVVVDPWGKLMHAGEAEGRSTFGVAATTTGKKAKKTAIKETGKASNLGHSKYAHAWCRELPSWLEQNNVLLIIVQHQNEHIDMGSYSPVTVSDAKNDTVIGGKAFAQLAAYRATLTNSGQWSEGDRVVGLKTRLMFIKNSYGPKFRTLDLRLKFEHHADTEHHFDPVTYYSHGLADWMATNGILNTKLTDKLYTCDTLKCVAVTADALNAALKQRPDVMQFIGTQMKIEGYTHVPMKTQPVEEDPTDVAPPPTDVAPPPPQSTGLPPEALAAIAAADAALATQVEPPQEPAEKKPKKKTQVLVDAPPPPPEPSCVTTPEDMRPEPPDGCIGGPSSLES